MAEAAAAGARTLVLGIAGAGGKVGADLIDDAAAALEAGMNVASGLHERLRDQPRLAALAAARGLQLFDVRDPPAGLTVGKGYPRAGPPPAHRRHRLLGRQDVRDARADPRPAASAASPPISARPARPAS